MLIRITRFSAAFQPAATEPAAASGASTARELANSMSGSLTEVPMGSVVQLLSHANSDGVLKVQRKHQQGSIHLQGGQVAHVTLTPGPSLTAKRTWLRLLRWKTGTFAFTKPEPFVADGSLDCALDFLLLDAAHYDDVITSLEARLPDLQARLKVTPQATTQPRSDQPTELQILDLVRKHAVLQAIIDNYGGDEITACGILSDLLESKVISPAV